MPPTARHPTDTTSPVPIREGLVYSPTWFSPQDSAFTRLAKIFSGCGVSYRTMARHLFGRRFSETGIGNRRHCANTLLVSDWLQRHGAFAEESLSAEVCRHTLTPVFGDRVHEFAGDDRLRYCGICLDHGFHSVVCQVDAVVLCPVHGCPLLEHCRWCGQPTPIYGITGFLASMRCIHCGRVFAAAWEAETIGRWKPFAEGERFALLETVLQKAMGASWLYFHPWSTYFLVGADKRRMRAASLLACMAAVREPPPQCFGTRRGAVYEAKAGVGPDGAQLAEQIFFAMERRLREPLTDRIREALSTGIVQLGDGRRPFGSWRVHNRRSEDVELVSFLQWRCRFVNASDTFAKERFDAPLAALGADASDLFFRLALRAERHIAEFWIEILRWLEHRKDMWTSTTLCATPLFDDSHFGCPPGLGVLEVTHDRIGTPTIHFALACEIFPLEASSASLEAHVQI